MIVVRIIGWVFLFFGVILMSHDIFRGMTSATGFTPITLGDAWDSISPGASDNLLGSVKMNDGETAAKFVAFFTNGWAFLLLLLPGIFLEAICRPKPDPAHRRASRMTREAKVEARKAQERLRRKSAVR